MYIYVVHWLPACTTMCVMQPWMVKNHPVRRRGRRRALGGARQQRQLPSPPPRKRSRRNPALPAQGTRSGEGLWTAVHSLHCMCVLHFTASACTSTPPAQEARVVAADAAALAAAADAAAARLRAERAEMEAEEMRRRYRLLRRQLCNGCRMRLEE